MSIGELSHASYNWSVSAIEEVKDDTHGELENTDSELQKDLEVNCEKIDESDELLSENLKILVLSNDENIVGKRNWCFFSYEAENQNSKQKFETGEWVAAR